jgi:hypothetical protein
LTSKKSTDTIASYDKKLSIEKYNIWAKENFEVEKIYLGSLVVCLLGELAGCGVFAIGLISIGSNWDNSRPLFSNNELYFVLLGVIIFIVFLFIGKFIGFLHDRRVTKQKAAIIAA